jgi:Concanavalin A-like lectin/glucanases superfamily
MANAINGLVGYFHYNNIYVPDGTEATYTSKVWEDISPSSEVIQGAKVYPSKYTVDAGAINIHTSYLYPVTVYPPQTLMDGTHKSFGYELWVKGNVDIGDASMTNNIYLLNWSGLNSSTQISLNLQKDGGLDFKFLNYPTGSFWNGGTTIQLALDALREWTLLSVYYDSTDRTASLYMNGELLYKSPSSPEDFIPFNTGSSAWVLGYAVNYNLSSVKFYDKALTSDEVMKNYLTGWESEGLVEYTVPPVAPTNLIATNITGNSITLQWDTVAETDSYVIKRNGVVVGDLFTLNFTDTGLAENTTYNYEVIAKNYLGESSPVTISVKTLDIVVATTVESFEDENFEFNNTGSWNITADDKRSGLNSLKSKVVDNIYHVETHSFEIPIPTTAFNAKMSFYYKFFEYNSDGIKFVRVNGSNEVLNKVTDWTLYESPLEVGITNTLTLEHNTGLKADSYMLIDDLTVTYSIENATPSTEPQVTIVDISKSKISDETGMDRAIVTFKFSKDVTEYKVLVNGVDHTTGFLADSGGVVIADTDVTAEIDFTELGTEGNHRINIYGCTSDGTWTKYQA